MPNSTTAAAPSIPGFSVSNAAAVSEGGNLVFTVTKSGSTPLTYSVRYGTANGTATTADYTAKSGMLSFGPTETAKTVTIATTEDAAAEANETVLMNLSLPSGGATIADAQGSGTITNDDAANTAPVAATDSTSMTTCAIKTINVTANDTDADGDLPLTVVSATGNSRMGASVASATSVQLMSTQLTGSASVSYTIKDSRGLTDSGTINVSVTSGGMCTMAIEESEGTGP
jgi:hypothetical protein